MGVFVAQRSSQGLVVVARTIVDVSNDWFAFVVDVRESVVIHPIRVKDRFDGALSPPVPIRGLFVVIVVESLNDVLPKGFLAEITLCELIFFLRHELSERAKEAKVQDICIG